jgi:hypothetical protein
MAAARRRARYEIGDPSWAEVILAAYRDPDTSDRYLTAEEELSTAPTANSRDLDRHHREARRRGLTQ